MHYFRHTKSENSNDAEMETVDDYNDIVVFSSVPLTRCGALSIGNGINRFFLFRRNAN